MVHVWCFVVSGPLQSDSGGSEVAMSDTMVTSINVPVSGHTPAGN